MNIISLILVKREGLNKKWWHRLSNVLVFGSTIILTILLVLAVSTSSAWKKFSFNYSFEPSYLNAPGQEQDCIFVGHEYPYSSPLISCGDITSSSDFLSHYTAAKGTTEAVAKLKNDDSLTDDQIVNAAINTGKLDDIKFKKDYSIKFEILFSEIAFSLLVLISWFIFWESIVYRALVYIVLGQHQRSTSK